MAQKIFPTVRSTEMRPHEGRHSELSSVQWAQRFLGSKDVRELRGTFRDAVSDFITAMREAGMRVVVEATFRPPQRSYLMHWSWRMLNNGIDPASIPAMAGVPIGWKHATKAESVAAARKMVAALSISRLRTAPALQSQHNLGLAIDMSISWTGTVTIKNAEGNLVSISSFPRTGMNPQLIKIGAGYGVKKYHGGMRDIPHWSNNGR